MDREKKAFGWKMGRTCRTRWDYEYSSRGILCAVCAHVMIADKKPRLHGRSRVCTSKRPGGLVTYYSNHSWLVTYTSTPRRLTYCHSARSDRQVAVYSSEPAWTDAYPQCCDLSNLFSTHLPINSACSAISRSFQGWRPAKGLHHPILMALVSSIRIAAR
jgi:hypothetical protein